MNRHRYLVTYGLAEYKVIYAWSVSDLTNNELENENIKLEDVNSIYWLKRGLLSRMEKKVLAYDGISK